MLIGLVLMGILYLLGSAYHTLAFYGAAAVVILWLVSSVQHKPSADKKKSPYLDPIVIESTRGAPYRIPEKMTLKYKPEASPSAPMWAKASGSGLGDWLGKSIGSMLRKATTKPEEKKKDGDKK